MTDRELLERAARAAGLTISADGMLFDGEVTLDRWNPLNDDGDAPRHRAGCGGTGGG